MIFQKSRNTVVVSNFSDQSIVETLAQPIAWVWGRDYLYIWPMKDGIGGVEHKNYITRPQNLMLGNTYWTTFMWFTAYRISAWSPLPVPAGSNKVIARALLCSSLSVWGYHHYPFLLTYSPVWACCLSAADQWLLSEEVRVRKSQSRDCVLHLNGCKLPFFSPRDCHFPCNGVWWGRLWFCCQGCQG